MVETANKTQIEEIESYYVSDMDIEIDGMTFKVELFFPQDGESVSDKLNRIADEKSKVS
ncbi:hypothetical protein SAMN02910317_03187 [Ruminococcaceae bacterium FB2012]|nr:hypothetical protein SAMN02910317_03187 [Ruminococcaceae bacterium FB2012]